MCGLFGIWHKNGDRKRLDVDEITGVMAHRGPDDRGSVSLDHVQLGFRRLGILDLSENGRQPMKNEDETVWLVCNGEVYNYLELRDELQSKGHVFRSTGDSEVILHLYEEEGEDCIKKLRGMFAFCVYDARKNLFFGARDRFGIKPLFYTENSRYFALASEAKALLNIPGSRALVNEEAIPHYLTFQYVPEPQTMFKGIFKIPPAHSFTYQNGRLELKRYWQIIFKPENRPLEEFLEGTRQVLREAVRLHTRSDVPWGAFLSGGIDSTVIVALLRETGPVSTFSVGYEHAGYSELAEAARTARYLETDHEEYVISPEEFWRQLPRLVWHFDDPVADPAAISLYFVARMAKKKITVTLSGEGADEVFGGYAIYREPNSLRPVSWLPPGILRTVSGVLPHSVPGKNFLRRAGTPLESRYFGNAYIFSEAEKKKLLKKKGFLPATAVTAPLYRQVKGLDDVSKMQYIDLNTWMVGDILVKADKMTMANSLELRVPYLDHRVFEFAASIPARYKIKGGLTKFVLRQAFRDLVPPEAVNRPKRGFPVPTRVWLKGPLKKEARELLQSPRLAGYISPVWAEKLLDDHLRDRADNSRKIWTLLILALWLEQFDAV